MQPTAKSVLRIAGKTLVGDVVKKSGAVWEGGFTTALPELQNKYPTATTAVIQGSQAHKSNKDPSDTKDVVTVGLYSEKGTRVGSAHVHEDGTFTDQPSRAGKK